MKNRLLPERKYSTLSVASTIAMLFFYLFAFQITTAQVNDFGDFPSSRVPPTKWVPYKYQASGSWTTVNVTNHGITPGNQNIDAGPIIQNLVDGYSQNQRIRLYFPAGTYYLNSKILLRKSNLWIDGDGPSNTIIKVNTNNNGDPSIRIVWPLETQTNTSVNGTVDRGDNNITVANGAGISAGEGIRIREGGNSSTGAGQIAIVSSRNGNQITLNRRIGLDLSNPEVVSRPFTTNIRITDLHLDQDGSPAIGNELLRFFGVQDFLIRNVDASGFSSGGISLGSCINGEVRDCKVYDYTGPVQGGWGNGIQVTDLSTNIHVTDNETEDLRHGIWIGGSANHCVIGYNLTKNSRAYADIGEHHAGNCHNNLFEGNEGFQIYTDNIDANHPDSYFTVYYRNRAKTKVGFERIDIGKGVGGQHINGSVVGNDARVTNSNSNLITGSATGVLDDIVNGLVGGNVIQNNNTQWGDFGGPADLPPSLAYASKPNYVASWPLFGPPTGLGGGPSNNFPDPNKWYTIESVRYPGFKLHAGPNKNVGCDCTENNNSRNILTVS
ncbi:MAG: glycosyl hydrolase family 28-related protein, partial [Bacteroidota bacterium]